MKKKSRGFDDHQYESLEGVVCRNEQRRRDFLFQSRDAGILGVMYREEAIKLLSIKVDECLCA